MGPNERRIRELADRTLIQLDVADTAIQIDKLDEDLVIRIRYKTQSDAIVIFRVEGRTKQGSAMIFSNFVTTLLKKIRELRV